MALIKQIMTVELLYDDNVSEDPRNMSLTDIADEMMNGGMSGIVKAGERKTLTKAQMAKALIMQGSDPEFLIPKEELLE